LQPGEGGFGSVAHFAGATGASGAE
jgi:hypothetical protein